MNLNATIQAILNLVGASNGDLAVNGSTIALKAEAAFTTGAGANQVNEVFSDTRTLADSASENLDLAGSLTNAFGVTVALARVKFIFIRNKSSTQVLSVGGAASNQFINWVGDPTDVVKIRPGGFLLLVAPDATGYAVTAGTGDLLKIANGNAGQSTDYDIVIGGALS